MKKFIAILIVLIVLTGAVFATTGDILNIIASVLTIKPSFTMVGGFDTNYGTTASDDSSTNQLESEVNISENSIDVYIQVKQSIKSRYKNQTGFDLTIAAEGLSATIEGVTYSTAVPVITSASDGNSIENALDSTKNDFTSEKKSAEEGSGTVVYTLKYPTGAPVAANTVVGEIQFTWEADDSLPVGTYSASITMTHTTI